MTWLEPDYGCPGVPCCAMATPHLPNNPHALKAEGPDLRRNDFQTIWGKKTRAAQVSLVSFHPLHLSSKVPSPKSPSSLTASLTLNPKQYTRSRHRRPSQTLAGELLLPRLELLNFLENRLVRLCRGEMERVCRVVQTSFGGLRDWDPLLGDSA